MEKIWSHPDVRSGLKLDRDDIGFAQEKIMAWHEELGVARPHYLFKLRPPDPRELRRADEPENQAQIGARKRRFGCGEFFAEFGNCVIVNL
jgi:hypothetical protein